MVAVMQGFWAILPLNLASEYTSRVRQSRDCKLFFFLQQALVIKIAYFTKQKAVRRKRLLVGPQFFTTACL